MRSSCLMLPTLQGSGCGHCRSAGSSSLTRSSSRASLSFPVSRCLSHSGLLTLAQSLVGLSRQAGCGFFQSPSALRFLAGLSLYLTGNSSTYKVTPEVLRRRAGRASGMTQQEV